MDEPRILIVGGSGFVGSWLFRSLREQLKPPASVIATSRRGGRIDVDQDTRALDVTDPVAVDDTIRSIEPTCIVHLAAIANVQDASQLLEQAWDVNLRGAMHVARSALKHVPAARFIFVSSAEVYGDTFNRMKLPLDEDAPLAPTNTYATSKAAADLFLGQMAHQGLRTIRFRPFNHTGPGQSEKFAVPSFAAQVARIERGLQEPVVRVGNLDAQRDFLDVRDVVDAYTRAILGSQEIPPGTIMNIASGLPRRLGSILEGLIRQANVPIRVEVEQSRMRPSDTPMTVGNANRAKALLGWNAQIPWEKTVEGLLAHFRESVRY